VNFVALQCACCGAWILCPTELRPGMAYATPMVMLPVERCLTCGLALDPLVHTIKLPIKHKMPGGGLIH
jgi:hypothetical protein